MGFNFDRAKLRADRIIRRYGGPAKLRRTSGDRPCIAAFVEVTGDERQGQLLNPLNRLVLVSGKSLDGVLAPNQDADSLVLLNEAGQEIAVLKIMEPPGKLEPRPGDVIYWELVVKGSQR